MKLTIQGFEIITGKAKNTGRDYDMSRIHCVIPLQESANAKGYAGTSYQAPAHLIEKIKHLPMPVVCDVEMQDVMRFGERQQHISSIQPVSTAKAA